jgi:hypothetical protein
MTGNFASSLEAPETIARFALNTARYNLPADYYETYLQKLAEVTPDQVSRMAMKYIRPDRAYLLIVGEKAIGESLSRFSTDRKVRYYDITGKPVVENTTKVPEGMNAQKVIANYLAAIGGEDAIKAIKDITREGSLKGVMSVDIASKQVQKQGNKFLFELKIGPQTMMKQVFDGKQGYQDGMEGKAALEGKDLEDVKREAVMFHELEYSKDIYTLLLKGIETVGSQNAYAVEITDLAGYKITNYYAMESGLKLRELRNEMVEDKPQLIVQDFDDYREVSGVKFPHSSRINGAFPVPAKVDYTLITVNSDVADTLFDVK